MSGSDTTSLDDIIAYLRQEGCSVVTLPFLPSPDKKTPTGTLLLVGRLGLNWLFLYKDQAKRPSMQVATPTEKGWLLGWKGHVMVIENLAQAQGAMHALP